MNESELRVELGHIIGRLAALESWRVHLSETLGRRRTWTETTSPPDPADELLRAQREAIGAMKGLETEA